jgi:hypothetical protein
MKRTTEGRSRMNVKTAYQTATTNRPKDLKLGTFSTKFCTKNKTIRKPIDRHGIPKKETPPTKKNKPRCSTIESESDDSTLSVSSPKRDSKKLANGQNPILGAK